MRNIEQKLRRYFQTYSVALGLPVLIGLVSGLEAMIVRTIIPFTFGRVLAVAHINSALTVPVVLFFLLGGAYFTGLIVEKMKAVSGAGLDVAVESYHSEAGLTPRMFAPLKFLATFLTLGFGGSGGLVGPIAAIGQGTASFFSRLFKLPYEKSRMMALSGIAGCVSGLLHTPFGAAVFALELSYMSGIIYKDLVPVLLSSLAAYVMSARLVRFLPFGDFLQQPHLFRSVVYDTPFPWSLTYMLYSLIAAIVTTIIGILFVKTFLALQAITSKRLRIRYRPVVGAALVGLIAVVFFRNNLTHVMGEAGTLVEQYAAGTTLSLGLAIVLLMGRWVTTFLTVGS